MYRVQWKITISYGFFPSIRIGTATAPAIHSKPFFPEMPQDLTKQKLRKRSVTIVLQGRRKFFNIMVQDKKLRRPIQETRDEIKRIYSTFMPSVNHQIGASLNVIVGCTDLLAKRIRVEDRKSNKLLNAIADASNWLERSLRMLLDLSQIEARLSRAQDTHLAEPRVNLRLELVCRYVKLIGAELAVQGKKNKVKVLPRPKRMHFQPIS